MPSSSSFKFSLEYAVLLVDSYTKLTGFDLLDSTDRTLSAAEALYYAPFALMSHSGAPDPVFNFANQTTLQLFEMDWESFTRMPSRMSAEPENRAERAALLRRVSEQGYIDDYSGIRISSTGKRFRIHRATVWNVTDDTMKVISQAAMFKHWEYI